MASEQRISDDAVRKATGKSWTEWFERLDAAGMQRQSHATIVERVCQDLTKSAWWGQMVAVEYERARGLREMNQACAGDFQVSVSRTLTASPETIYGAWMDGERETWLPGAPVDLRKCTPHKSVRLGWHGKSAISVLITPKGEGKTSMTVDQVKLGDADEVATQRAYWAQALDRLKTHLEHNTTKL